MERKKRIASRDAKRWRTIRARKGYDKIVEDARRAGRLTPTKFDTESSLTANSKRWHDYYLEHPDKWQARLAKEAKKRKKNVER